jgi:DNA-binding transcriptional LysR family regulator
MIPLKRIDLNLIQVLDVIYTEQSISRAAARLCLSQSAVSHSLKRLRDLYQDPLFIRSGNRMLPTSFLSSHIKGIRLGLDSILDSMSSHTQLELSEHKQTMQLGMHQGTAYQLMPELIEELSREAPGIDFKVSYQQLGEITARLDSLAVDMCIDLRQSVPSHILSRKLCVDRLEVVVARGVQAVTMEQYLSAQHIVVSPTYEGIELIDYELSNSNVERKVKMRCQDYFVAAKIIENSDYIGTFPRNIARMLATKYALNCLPSPFSIPEFELRLYWHQQSEHDPVSQWLRQKLFKHVDRLIQQYNNTSH